MGECPTAHSRSHRMGAPWPWPRRMARSTLGHALGTGADGPARTYRHDSERGVLARWEAAGLARSQGGA